MRGRRVQCDRVGTALVVAGHAGRGVDAEGQILNRRVVIVRQGASVIVAVDPGDPVAAGGAAQQDIEVAVTVVVAPLDGTFLDARQPGLDGDEGAAVVAIETGHGLGPALTDQKDVEIAVRVVVACREGAVRNPQQPSRPFHEAPTVIAIDQRLRAGERRTGQEDIEIAIAIDVRPLTLASVDVPHRGPIDECASLIAVEVRFWRGLVDAESPGSGQQEIEVAVVVVVPPGDAAVVEVPQALGDPGEAPAIVAVEPRVAVSHRRWVEGIRHDQCRSCDDKVEVSVVVVVPPGSVGVEESGQANAGIGEDPAVIAVEPRCGLSDQQDVQIAVAVVVPPGNRTGRGAREIGEGVGERPAVVQIEVGDLTARSGRAEDQDIQVAVAVGVAPGHVAVTRPGQAGSDVGPLAGAGRRRRRSRREAKLVRRGDSSVGTANAIADRQVHDLSREERSREQRNGATVHVEIPGGPSHRSMQAQGLGRDGGRIDVRVEVQGDVVPVGIHVQGLVDRVASGEIGRRQDGQSHPSGVGQLPVGEDVGEGVGAVEVRVRRVGERSVGG